MIGGLSEKDKDWISKTIEESIQKELKNWIDSFLKYEVTGDHGAQGPGEIPGRIEKQNIFVFDALMVYLPRIAAAMRGSQADAVIAKNRAIEANNSVKSLEAEIKAQTNVILPISGSIKTIARFAVALKETGLLEQMEKALTIEYKLDETNT
jgi:hypothetical protein